MTTIQVDEEIKQKLLEIAGKLQIQLKRKVTFNDTIRYLIEKQEGTGNLRDLRGLYGFLNAESKEAMKLLTNLRHEEEDRLERFKGKLRS